MTTAQGVKLHLQEVVQTVLRVLNVGSQDLRRQGAGESFVCVLALFIDLLTID